MAAPAYPTWLGFFGCLPPPPSNKAAPPTPRRSHRWRAEQVPGHCHHQIRFPITPGPSRALIAMAAAALRSPSSVRVVSGPSSAAGAGLAKARRQQASRVSIRGAAGAGQQQQQPRSRRAAAIRASLFSPKPAAAKDARPTKVQELYVYEINERDRENPAYLRLSAKQQENALGDLIPSPLLRPRRLRFATFPMVLGSPSPPPDAQPAPHRPRCLHDRALWWRVHNSRTCPPPMRCEHAG